MNDFLQQFLIESRELVEQASDGLLTLERTPRDIQQLDVVFRAFHTLKGGAGIVEFAAMERAVHAAEDVLTEARTGKRVLSTADIGNCLTCLDQVSQWLDALEHTGELPAASSATEAEKIAHRFGPAQRDVAGPPSHADDSAAPAWIADILGRHLHCRGHATTAIRFVPDPECLFQGEDPVARTIALEDLLALEIEPAQPWPALQSLDPFTCNLVLIALTASSVADVRAHLQGVSGNCEILAIAAARTQVTDSGLPQRVREILEAQRALIKDGKPESWAGRVASAGLTASHVLRYCGRRDEAERLAHATRSALARRAPEPLQEAISQMLASQVPLRVGAAPEAARADLAPRTLRVDAQRIDALVRLTGELTVAKNSLHHLTKLARTAGNSMADALKDQHGVFEHLIGELQRSVLAMRVLPLRSVLQRFPRVLRELSASLGKPAQLQIEGEDTEADKAIVEMLFEPLLHVLRNALDHGVEPPKERTERGKPAVATIQIRAARQSDQIVIEVSDDGAGIDVERVRQVARDRGVISEAALRTMTQAQVIDLLFAAGFSTAEKVSELSGRGVGMDAVRTAVARFGGRVAIDSRAGHGTTVKFSLPFSAMMTPLLAVEAGGQMFGIPLDTVVETLRVPKTAIGRVGTAPAIVLRERTVPVLELASLVGATPRCGEDADAILVIAGFAGQYGGFRVDRLGESLEVMLKPLDGLLAETPGVTGTTLLGDGRVLLVLDIGAMLQ